MIFYFTGTGNSLYAARYLSANIHDDKLINIADAVKNGEYFYYLHEGEAAGFVFPVYYGGMPSVVNDFVKQLRLTSEEDPYVYALCTYGGTPFGAIKSFRNALENRDTDLSASFAVKMPDNYVVMYDPSDEKTAEQTLRAAETGLLTAASSVLLRTHDGTGTGAIDAALAEASKLGVLPRKGVGKGTTDAAMTAGMQLAYRFMRKTAKFYADENCVGCGRCAAICPVEAIALRDGKPVWVKKECAHCVACISRCPMHAIQYGDATKERGRYVHPIFKETAE